MTDAIIEAAATIIDIEIENHSLANKLAEQILAAVTPLIEANALERAAKMADGWGEGAAIGNAIRSLKEQL